MKKSILTLLVLLPLLSLGQTTWTLKSCIDYGLKNNRSQTVYKNDKEAADARAREALSAYLPSVSLNGEVDDNLKPQTTVIPAGVFGPTDTRVAFTKRYNTTATAQLDQTIFDKSLLTGLKANRYNKEQAILSEQQNDEAIIYNISSSYYQIFVYREQIGLQQANVETYRKQKDIIGLQVQKGTKLKKDLDKVTVDLNNALSQIKVAESNLALAENQLKYDMGYPITGPLVIDSVAARKAVDLGTPKMVDTTNFNVSNRVDYRLSEVDSKLLEIDEKRIRDGIYPKLSAFARYGGVGFSDQLGPSISNLNSYSVIGLKLNFPLFDFYKRNAQHSQARVKRLNAQETLKLNEGKYQLEYQNARTKLLKEQSNVENNQENIGLAQSVFKVTDLQYTKGTTDLTDWLNARNSIKEAQNNYLQSLYNFILARIDLEKSAGTLKTFYSALP